jgi:hypothetical protein
MTDEDAQYQSIPDQEAAARAERRAFFHAEAERESRQGLVAAQLVLGSAFTPQATQTIPDTAETRGDLYKQIAEKRPPTRDEAEMSRLGQTGASE